MRELEVAAMLTAITVQILTAVVAVRGTPVKRRLGGSVFLDSRRPYNRSDVTLFLTGAGALLSGFTLVAVLSGEWRWTLTSSMGCGRGLFRRPWPTGR